VSTLQQEQEATIDSQIAELEKYAREKGYALSKEYYFFYQAVSGAQLARPALDRLRDLAGEGMFETYCVSARIGCRGNTRINVFSWKNYVAPA
jgi:DNA invertase Pin-like site-specific DNA recombinase